MSLLKDCRFPALQKRGSWLVLLFFFVMFPGKSFPVENESAIPEKPLGWISDYAQLLNAGEIAQLNQRLASLESQTSTQIFVAIFPKLPKNFYLEDFTTRLFEKWRLGTNQNNNGVLLAIFLGDRELRIEVGYGLEDVLTDALSHQIIYNDILPYFKNGAFFQGISQGVNTIRDVVAGKYKTPVPKESSDSFFEILFFIIILIIVISQFLRQFRSSTTYSGRGYRRNTWGTPGGFFPSSGRFRGSSGTGPVFRGGFGGLSGGGGASGKW